MNEHDVRDLVGCLISTHDMLRDVANAGPTPATPPGLHRHLAAVIRQLGDPTDVLQKDAVTGLLVVDRDGFTRLAFDLPTSSPVVTPPDSAETPFPAAVLAIYGALSPSTLASDTDFDRLAQERGLVGIQLEAKRAVIDYGHETYVAGGRLTEGDKKDDRWFARTRRRLAKALGVASPVIDSMSHLPGLGVLGMVKEGTDIVGGGLDLAD
jgi:hypothetical protein